MHNYHITIKEKQNRLVFNRQNEVENSHKEALQNPNVQLMNEKLENYGMGMYIVKNFTETYESKIAQKHFNKWKQKTILQEWRMNQTAQSKQH